MGCSASVPAKGSAYAVAGDAPEPAKAPPAKAPPPPTAAASAAPTPAPADDGVSTYEAIFLSAGDAEGVANRISDELEKGGYKVAKARTALARTSSVVVCLSADFFSAASSCLADFCAAAELGLSIVLVVLELVGLG